MPTPYRHALAVSWCVVGEPEQIRALLQLVTHLGKKTEMGWGAVADWSVEPSSVDWSVRDAAGRLMRPVPAETGMLYGYRPPYWHPRNQTTCEMPSLAEATA
jgi:CRISPR type IV-associated protein Csf3